VIITDERQFSALRHEWNALLDASGSRSPFLKWEWMQAWWHHLRGTATLHVITARSNGRLIGVAPLVLRPRQLAGPARLEFLGAGIAGADYLDLIVDSGREDEAIMAIAAELKSSQLPLLLDHLPPASIAADLETPLTSLGWRTIESSPDVCPVVDLAGHSFDSFLATLGASHRANFRRRCRALHAAFEVRFEPVSTDAERRAALGALSRFHAHRFQGPRGSTAFGDPSLERFHDDFTRAARDAGWLRLFVLSLDGVTAAVMYGFMLDRRFYFYQHGFGDAYADHSVGLVLMGLTIRAAIEEGAIEFDMLYGHEPYKYLWARVERSLTRLRLFPPHIGGQLLHQQAEARNMLRSLAHQIGLRSHDHA
jgi:CelD/BcsL family acetyltransferase involved in cellulose biosynthesis